MALANCVNLISYGSIPEICVLGFMCEVRNAAYFNFGANESKKCDIEMFPDRLRNPVRLR